VISGPVRAVRRCVCPGSFDPVTVGHLDVIARAARLFDEVVVAVLHNPAKPGTFSVAERIAQVEGELAHIDGVVVQGFSDRLLVDVCAEVNAEAIVKGVRSDSDYAYELPMALMNRHLAGVETLFIPADPRFVHISSSLVREVVMLGGDVSGMVSDGIRDALVARRPRRPPSSA
jgi:pantetheine-phosphate adenylyltransferase